MLSNMLRLSIWQPKERNILIKKKKYAPMQLSTVHLGLNRYDKLSTKIIISTENSYPWQNRIDQVPNQGIGWKKKQR